MKNPIAIFIAGLVVSLQAGAIFAANTMTLYKSPSCGCCDNYVDYLRENGINVKSINLQDMTPIKHRYGIDDSLASCHTSLIDGYVVEGHVPVNAIHKMLKSKPQIVGITAPGMPLNSPGMGEVKKGTLAIYTLPNNGDKSQLFSVE